MSAPVRWTSFARAALIGAVAGVAACAQSTPEYQAKVVLLEKLTRFVEWPGQPFANRAFVLILAGMALATMTSTAMASFVPAYMQRTLARSPLQVGLILGLIMALVCLVSWVTAPVVNFVRYLAASPRLRRVRTRETNTPG